MFVPNGKPGTRHVQSLIRHLYSPPSREWPRSALILGSVGEDVSLRSCVAQLVTSYASIVPKLLSYSVNGDDPKQESRLDQGQSTHLVVDEASRFLKS